MSFITNLDPQTVQGWIAVLGGLVALITAWRRSTEVDRWNRIRSVLPDAHRLAQRAAELTNTRKDDEFLRQVDRLLSGWGIELRPEEVEPVRAMGSAEHQTYKLMRDGGAEGNFPPGPELGGSSEN